MYRFGAYISRGLVRPARTRILPQVRCMAVSKSRINLAGGDKKKIPDADILFPRSTEMYEAEDGEKVPYKVYTQADDAASGSESDSSDDDSDRKVLDDEEGDEDKETVGDDVKKAEEEAKEAKDGPDLRIVPRAWSRFGYKYKGMEPTKFGDWQHKGRCTDFT
eukprot:gene685-269_t